MVFTCERVSVSVSEDLVTNCDSSKMTTTMTSKMSMMTMLIILRLTADLDGDPAIIFPTGR